MAQAHRDHVRYLVRVFLAEAALVVVYVLLPLDRGRWPGGVAVGLGTIAAAIAVVALRGRRLAGSQRPLVDIVAALSMMLVLLVLGFAAAYYSLAAHGPHFVGLRTKLDAVYFTLTTLSTVGFGDVAARSQAARGLVSGQIVLDLTFVTVAVRLLVARARTARSGDAGAAPA